MGNVLLDAMQGTLICLDNHHIIIEVSKSIKQYFGFEQVHSRRRREKSLIAFVLRWIFLVFQLYYSLKIANEIYSQNFFRVHHNVSRANDEEMIGEKFLKR